MNASRNQPSGDAGPNSPRSPQAPAPSVACDLCEAPMTLPAICQEQGEVLGLLVCTQCIEDELESRVHAPY